MTRKLIIHDGRGERELLLVGTITVGRDPACHINDLDPLLSRRHAEFVTTKSGCTVRDLGSRNGMLVNGEKSREHRLSEGDLVQLGHLQLRYAEDQSVVTQDASTRAHATTAHASATMAVPNAALEDTRPHPHHQHAGAHEDPDATRSPGARDKKEEPTMAPRGSAGAAPDDNDETMAPGGKPAKPMELDATFVAGSGTDMDATFTPGMGGSLDATFAPGTPFDPDATFVAGMTKPAVQPTPSADVAAPLAPARSAVPSADLDKTIAPGSIDFDATFLPGRSPTPPVAGRPSRADARLTAGADLRIVTATPACHDLFGVSPEALVGRPLGDVLAERLKLACAAGPSELTFIVERSTSDRSLIVVLKTAQAVETVS